MIVRSGILQDVPLRYAIRSVHNSFRDKFGLVVYETLGRSEFIYQTGVENLSNAGDSLER